MESKNRRIGENSCLNVLKGFICIGVVFVHAMFPGQVGVAVMQIASAAVPVFFLISGFYAYASDEKKIAVQTKRKLQKIVGLTGKACLLYLAWVLCKSKIQDGSLAAVKQCLSIRNFAKLLLQNDLTFIEAGHFWFLLALIYAYITLYLLNRYKKIHWAFPLVILAFACRIWTTHFFSFNWHYSQNFWVYGFPYFFTGYYIRMHQEKITKLSSNGIMLLACLGILFRTSDLVYLLPFDLYEAGAIVFSIGLFLWAIKNPEKGKNSIMGKIGKQYSMWIYVMHVLIFQLLTFLEPTWNFTGQSWYGWCRPVAVALVSLFSGILYVKIKNCMQEKMLHQKS